MSFDLNETKIKTAANIVQGMGLGFMYGMAIWAYPGPGLITLGVVFVAFIIEKSEKEKL